MATNLVFVKSPLDVRPVIKELNLNHLEFTLSYNNKNKIGNVKIKRPHFSTITGLELFLVEYESLNNNIFKGDLFELRKNFLINSDRYKEITEFSKLIYKNTCKCLKSSLEEFCRFSKHMLAGAMSAVVSKTSIAPLERVRFDIVLNNTKVGPLGTMASIYKSEGFFGFWKGNSLNIIRTAPFKGLNYFSYDMYTKALLKLTGRKDGNLERFLAGALAGATAVVMCIPLDTLRTRMLKNENLYKNIFDAGRLIVRKEGIGALYKGCIPAILSIAPSSAVFYGVFNILKNEHIKNHKIKNNTTLEIGIAHTLLYGAIAGMCAEAAVYPLEIIKRELQMQTIGQVVASKGMMKLSLNSVLSTCGNIAKNKGISGFYSGVMLNAIQVLPSAALGYFAYETFKNILQVDSNIDGK